MKNQTTDLPIPCSDALSLSHRDGEQGYYEVHIWFHMGTQNIFFVLCLFQDEKASFPSSKFTMFDIFNLKICNCFLLLHL